MDALEAIFGPNGRIAGAHPNYEYRRGQIEMAAAVAGTLERGGVAVVEAGTGTGKTLAYLVPALAAGRRVIVSTATKSLQEQLYFKDVPFLQQLFPGRVRAAYMKGRSNYVCLHRLGRANESPILTGLAEVDHFEAVRQWASETETGDRAELVDLPEHLPFWHATDAPWDTCLGQRCPEFDNCFITKMRQRAEEADIVIVNHHLFFADLALRHDDYGQVIPDYTTVIFDESHELEPVAAGHFGSVVSNYRVDDLVADLQRLLVVDADALGDLLQSGARLVQRADRFWLGMAASVQDGHAEPRAQLSRPMFAGPANAPTRLGELYLDVRDTLAEDVRAGLTSELKQLPPKYFYDERGSELFDRITTLPEYYPTRAEREILNRRAPEIVRDSRASELVELGSGSASKTRALLYAMAGEGTLRRYVPLDVSQATVETCAAELTELYPGLQVHGVVGDFGRDLARVPDGQRRLFAFLGGTIGNLFPDERAAFLARLRELMLPDDRLLIGTDLVKDRSVLEAAYNDSQGVTAEFNRNLLRVVNDGLGANFEPQAFEHVAFFDEANSWIEMRLRANGAQEVRIEGADLELTFADGEEIRTEISAKFTRDAVESELADAGLRLDDFFTDENGLFALAMACPEE